MPGARIAVIGHLSIDEIAIEGERYENMGGAACYAALAARALGADVKIISTIGEDFPKSYLETLRRAGVDLSDVQVMAQGRTTRFEISYLGDKRMMRLLSRAEDIELKLHHEDLDGIYLGPVAWELDLDSIRRLIEEGARVLLDPQGLMRTIDESGFIRLRRLDLRIPGLWILRISREEAEILANSSKLSEVIDYLGTLGAEVTILTLGREGALILHSSKIIRVPCYPVKVVDPTGAGDVFGGAFLVEFLRSQDLGWAAAIGSAMASLVVESRGFHPLLSPNIVEEARRRAGIIHESIKQL